MTTKVSVLSILLIGALVGGMIGSPMIATPSGATQEFDYMAQDGRVKQPGVNGSYRNGIATLESSEITVKVTGAGHVPHFQFWPTGNNTTIYHAKFVKLVEYTDDDEDGAFQFNETVGGKIYAFASSASSWTFSDFYNLTEGGETIGFGFNFTMSDPTQPRWGDLAIKITNRFYLEDTTIETGNEAASYNLSGLGSLKTNIWVENWPFESDENKLALRWDITQGEKKHAKLNGEEVDFGRNMSQGSENPIEPPKGKQEVGLEFKAGSKAEMRLRMPTAVKLRNREENQARVRNGTISYRTETHDDKADKLMMYMSAHAADEIMYDPIIEGSSDISSTEPTEPTEPSDEAETAIDKLLGNPLLLGMVALGVFAAIATVIYTIRKE